VKVYLVTAGCELWPCGVFSTREKAQGFIDRIKATKPSRRIMEIFDFEVDDRVEVKND
jgi:hypothetical protein